MWVTQAILRQTDAVQISFHESFRIDGTDYYTIVDLPIRVTNSIPEDTELAGSQVRPRCDLRNNPLIPFNERNEAIRAPPSQPYLGGDFDGSNQGSNSNGNSNDSGNGGSDGGVLDPGSPGSGSLGVDPLKDEGSAKSTHRSSFLSLGSMLVLWTIYFV